MHAVRDYESALTEEEKLEAGIPIKTISNNGRDVIRFAACLGVLCQVTVTALYVDMVSVKGQDGSEADQVSTTLTVFAVLSCLCTIASVWDVVDVFRKIPTRTEPVDWHVHHRAFKHQAAVALVQILIFFPALTTFVFHSLGQNFFNARDDVPPHILERIDFHIALYVMTVGCSLAALGLVAYVQARRFSRRNVVEPRLSLAFAAGSKIHAVFMSVVACGYAFSVVRCAHEIPSSGTVASSALVVLLSLVVVGYALLLLVRSHQDKSWFLAFRAVHAVYAVVAFMSFWLVLLSLSMEGLRGRGFWAVVGDLSSKRRALVYAFVSMFFVYVFLGAWRVFLHKLRRKGRVPRQRLPEHYSAQSGMSQGSASALTFDAAVADDDAAALLEAVEPTIRAPGARKGAAAGATAAAAANDDDVSVLAARAHARNAQGQWLAKDDVDVATHSADKFSVFDSTAVVAAAHHTSSERPKRSAKHAKR